MLDDDDGAVVWCPDGIYPGFGGGWFGGVPKGAGRLVLLATGRGAGV